MNDPQQTRQRADDPFSSRIGGSAAAVRDCFPGSVNEVTGLRGDQPGGLLQVGAFPQVTDPALQRDESRAAVPDTRRGAYADADQEGDPVAHGALLDRSVAAQQWARGADGGVRYRGFRAARDGLGPA